MPTVTVGAVLCFRFQLSREALASLWCGDDKLWIYPVCADWLLWPRNLFGDDIKVGSARVACFDR